MWSRRRRLTVQLTHQTVDLSLEKPNAVGVAYKLSLCGLVLCASLDAAALGALDLSAAALLLGLIGVAGSWRVGACVFGHVLRLISGVIEWNWSILAKKLPEVETSLEGVIGKSSDHLWVAECWPG